MSKEIVDIMCRIIDIDIEILEISKKLIRRVPFYEISELNKREEVITQIREGLLTELERRGIRV